jgi:phosphatidylglycerol:prolipoprotein diacylglycerol transferase
VGSFALWVGLGASLGIWRLARSVDRQRGEWANVGLFVLFLSLLGARFSYVLINQAYFTQHPLEIPMLWLGGLTWPGALLGVLLALAYFTGHYRSPRTGKISPGWLGDRLYPMLPPIIITTWLGCWSSGSGYGAALSPGAWWGVPSPDESGAVLLRWPVQLAAALSLLAFFTLLEMRVQAMRPAGRISSLAVLGVLIHLLVFSFFAADPAPLWNGLRVDTWAALAYLIFFLGFQLATYLLARSRRRVRRAVRYSRL